MVRFQCVGQALALILFAMQTDASPTGEKTEEGLTHDKLHSLGKGASLASKAEGLYTEMKDDLTSALPELSEAKSKLSNWLTTLAAHQKRKQEYQKSNMARQQQRQPKQSLQQQQKELQQKMAALKREQQTLKHEQEALQKQQALKQQLQQQGTAQFAAKNSPGGISQLNQTQDPAKPPGSTLSPYGHIIPSAFGHWQWNEATRCMMFESNNGWSQARLDPPGSVKVGLGSNKAMVDAVDISEGTKIDFDEDSVNNERDLYDAQYYTGGKWVWSENKQVSRIHKIPQWSRDVGDGINPITKYYHALWKDSHTHMMSAYEPDFFRDQSEMFGPFRLDYHTSTVELLDWNFEVETDPTLSAGRGNMVVGPHHFYSYAKNSFLAGKHNTARGDNGVVLGGESNMVRGASSTVVGGSGNVANGWANHVTGGFHNEAMGNWNEVRGGARNRAEHNWATIAGGETNVVQGDYGTVLGGDGNKDMGDFGAVHGGWGNRVLAPEAVIAGGQGGKASKKFEVVTGTLSAEDEAVEEGQHKMEGEAGATGSAPVPDGGGQEHGEHPER